MAKLTMTGLLKRVTPYETIETKKGKKRMRYLILDTEVEKNSIHAFTMWEDHCAKGLRRIRGLRFIMI